MVVACPLRVAFRLRELVSCYVCQRLSVFTVESFQCVTYLLLSNNYYLVLDPSRDSTMKYSVAEFYTALALCKAEHKTTFQIEGGVKKNLLVSTSLYRGCGCLGGAVGGGRVI